MKIEYHKHPTQWSAKITIQGEPTYTSGLTLEAYGDTQEEARKALVKQILETTIDLLGVIEKI